MSGGLCLAILDQQDHCSFCQRTKALSYTVCSPEERTAEGVKHMLCLLSLLFCPFKLHPASMPVSSHLDTFMDAEKGCILQSEALKALKASLTSIPCPCLMLKTSELFISGDGLWCKCHTMGEKVANHCKPREPYENLEG